MAIFVLKNASVLINSVDLSNRVKKVTVNIKAADEDNTAMGAAGKGRIAGLRDDSISVEFNQDFAAANVDATLFPLVGAAAFPVIVKPVAGAASATNPRYYGNCLLTDYNPIDGAVGNAATTSVSLPVDGYLQRSASD